MEKRWLSYSKKNIAELTSWISSHLSRLGIENLLGRNFIQSSSFNIRFKPTDYGCELEVYIFKQNNDSVLFLELWQTLVNNGSAWGGPYRKELNAKNEKTPSPKDAPFVIMESLGADPRDIKLIKYWCVTPKTGKEIASILGLGKEQNFKNEKKRIIKKYGLEVPYGMKNKRNEWKDLFSAYLPQWKKELEDA